MNDWNVPIDLSYLLPFQRYEVNKPKNVGPLWPWSYGSWIYNYLCNQCLSPLMLWVRISIRARCTTLCDKVCQWLVTGRWFSPGPPVSSTNKTDRHDITEILLKVALNTIKQINKPSWNYDISCMIFQTDFTCVHDSDNTIFKAFFSLNTLENNRVYSVKNSYFIFIGILQKHVLTKQTKIEKKKKYSPN